MKNKLKKIIKKSNLDVLLSIPRCYCVTSNPYGIYQQYALSNNINAVMYVFENLKLLIDGISKPLDLSTLAFRVIHIDLVLYFYNKSDINGLDYIITVIMLVR